MLGNGGGIFAARIVRGNHHRIGHRRGHRAHLLAFPRIPIAAAPKNHPQLARGNFAQCRKHLTQGIIRVRIIDIHCKRLAFHYRLQPAGHRRCRRQGFYAIFQSHAQCADHPQGQSGIGDVMAADQRHAEFNSIHAKKRLRLCQFYNLNEKIGRWCVAHGLGRKLISQALAVRIR